MRGHALKIEPKWRSNASAIEALGAASGIFVFELKNMVCHWIRVLLLTLELSSCTDYPTNEYSGSGYYGPPSYYPATQMVITRAQAITTVPHHTIPNPMGIRAPVGKWLPVIAETVATESKGLIPVPTQVTVTRALCLGTLLGL